MELEEFFDDRIPPYAILSHRWEEDELSYQDLQAGRNKHGAGFTKVQKCCAKALTDKSEWLWVDTCCIDKSSSAELSEAINAMFRWYKASTRCYAYLSDVDGVEDGSDCLHWPSFKASVWFSRGWTLQELIAPSDVLFLDSTWREIGTRTELVAEITAATGIPGPAFISLRQYCVAQIMSWASMRRTSRVEDLAYCLLGLFDVGIPLLYGEGERAFRRLQEEIMRNSDDESIFVWTIDPREEVMAVKKLQESIAIGMNNQSLYAVPNEITGAGNLFAPRPSCFAHGASILRDPIFWRPPYSLTNKGLRISAMLLGENAEEESKAMIPLNCTMDGRSPIAMCVARTLGGCIVRSGCVVMGTEVNVKGNDYNLLQAMREDHLSEIFISVTFPSQPAIHNLHRHFKVQEWVGRDGSRAGILLPKASEDDSEEPV